MDREELFEHAWEKLRDQWIPYVKNDVLSLTFFMQHTHLIGLRKVDLE